jgi:hypothetical protein
MIVIILVLLALALVAAGALYFFSRYLPLD